MSTESLKKINHKILTAITMKKLIIAFMLTTTGFFVNTSLSYAQDRIEYEYDAAGNRLGRTIIMSNRARSNNDMQESEPAPTASYVDVIDGQTTVTIYPNPTQGLLKIDIDNMPENNQSSIRIYDINGKMLLLKSNVENSTEIDLSSQSSGVYLLKINLSGKTTTWKIIKQ